MWLSFLQYITIHFSFILSINVLGKFVCFVFCTFDICRYKPSILLNTPFIFKFHLNDTGVMSLHELSIFKHIICQYLLFLFCIHRDKFIHPVKDEKYEILVKESLLCQLQNGHIQKRQPLSSFEEAKEYLLMRGVPYHIMERKYIYITQPQLPKTKEHEHYLVKDLHIGSLIYWSLFYQLKTMLKFGRSQVTKQPYLRQHYLPWD